MTHPCGCPADGRIVDQDVHDAFHALVVEQGGPAGVVNAETLQAARGFAFVAVKARTSGKRASGEQRRRAR